MLKYVLLLIIPSVIFAQESTDALDPNNINNQNFIEKEPVHKYVSLNDNKVYDIEIIIFAYQQALPNYKTYTNKVLFDDSSALELKLKPEKLSFIQEIPDTIITEVGASKDFSETDLTETNADEPDYTVSITDETEEKSVLAWFEHETKYYQLTAIWKKLENQNNLIPLVHKAWRQPDTPFENPISVKLNNLPVEDLDKNSISKNQANLENNTRINPQTHDLNINSVDGFQNSSSEMEIESEFIDDMASENNLNSYADFTVSGMVTLSQGRFMHFGHSLNLMRQYTDDNNEKQTMVFSLTERKQLNTDELHYYDSPWFGSIVKITEYLGED